MDNSGYIYKIKNRTKCVHLEIELKIIAGHSSEITDSKEVFDIQRQVCRISKVDVPWKPWSFESIKCQRLESFAPLKSLAYAHSLVLNMPYFVNTQS